MLNPWLNHLPRSLMEASSSPFSWRSHLVLHETPCSIPNSIQNIATPPGDWGMGNDHPNSCFQLDIFLICQEHLTCRNSNKKTNPTPTRTPSVSKLATASQRQCCLTFIYSARWLTGLAVHTASHDGLECSGNAGEKGLFL